MKVNENVTILWPWKSG